MGRWIFALLLSLGCQRAYAQLPIPERSGGRTSAQDASQRTDSATAQVLSELPDSIILFRYDPRFPIRQFGITDSALSLRYVRFDPVSRYGPDYVYLNNLVQPAAAQPLLGARYRSTRAFLQPTHPAYETPEAPFFGMNVPYAYAAYNQGGEIDDGQAEVLFGSPFANGWSLGFTYLRTYQAGERNRYQQAQGERIQLGATVSYERDSSHHRAYVSLALGSRGFFNPGGYTFARSDTVEVPTDPFLGQPELTAVRTEGSESTYAYLHRYFLQRQVDRTARGWAGSVELSRKQEAQRTAAPRDSLRDLAFFRVDDRGTRYAVSSQAVLAKAYLEYFTPASGAAAVDFDFRAGAYYGTQRFEGEFLTEALSQNLLGVAGEMHGNVARQFTLDADVDLALGARSGLGRINAALSWDYRRRFGLQAFASLERSEAPWTATRVGANDRLLRDVDLPVSTHTKIGGALTSPTLGLTARGYLEVFADGWVYDTFGLARAARENLAIPTLELRTDLNYHFLNLNVRGVLRAAPSSSEVYLPAYTGQHSLTANKRLFKDAMQLMVGIDLWVRSPVNLYEFSPILGVFHLSRDPTPVGWQYNADVFLAFKIQSFKAFVKLENALARGEGQLPPATVRGYPLVRGPQSGFYGELLRIGVAFSLYN